MCRKIQVNGLQNMYAEDAEFAMNQLYRIFRVRIIWHHDFNAAIRTNHVSIWKFMRFLKQEQQVLQEVLIFYLI